MRRAYNRRVMMWRVVPCGSRKSLRTDSWKDIEEILQSKLATINEEPENLEEADHHLHRNYHSSSNSSSPSTRLKRFIADKAKKKGSSTKEKNNNKSNNNKVGNFLVMPRFSIKDSYALFMTRFATKGSFGGLLQY